MMLPSLPSGLKDIINKGRIVKNRIGESGADVYKVISKDCNYYLKINRNDRWDNLNREKEIYEYLKDKVEVPKVIYYERIEETEYLLISEIKGNILSIEMMKKHPKNIVEVMAKALKALHSLDIKQCMLTSSIEVMLKEAKHRVDRGLVYEGYFEEKYRLKTSQQILEYLIKNKPLNEDLVFIHGDYCFSNVIALDGVFNGFIDIGRGGVGDKYRDIAIALRSIEHNLMNKKLWPHFMECYGEENLDMEKVNYYILLDELF